MKKNGIVLMTTLMFITILIGITLYFINISNDINKVSNKDFDNAKTIKLINELNRELPNIFQNINTAEELDLGIKFPLQINDEKQNFSILLDMSSPYKKYNINNLFNENNITNEKQLILFQNIILKYNIAFPETFINIVLDSIDKDLIEREEKSEIELYNINFYNGKIKNQEQFNLILQQYIIITKDDSILNVPWDKFIAYEGNKIDFNYVEPELLSLFLPDLENDKLHSITDIKTKAFISKEEIFLIEPKIEKFYNDFFFIYEPNIDYNILCNVKIDEGETLKNMKFYYNLKNKKIERWWI